MIYEKIISPIVNDIGDNEGDGGEVKEEENKEEENNEEETPAAAPSETPGL